MNISEHDSSDGMIEPGLISTGLRDFDHRRPHDRRSSVVIAQTTPDRVDVHKSLNVRCGEDDIVITHMAKSAPSHGMTDPHIKSAAFTACLHLTAFSDCDVWCDGTREPSPPLPAGAVHIHDMRHAWSADVQGPFSVVNFYIPQSALDSISDDLGASRIDNMRCPMSDAKVDDVFKHLALALLPALREPDQANKLFVDHAWRAVTAYLARSYGALRSAPASRRGGLAPWQERRAKEMLLADLSGNLTLPDLARACRLSCSHFSQAFRMSVGCPPHQWLLVKRVERAKHLLLNTSRSLSDIALETGFSDQSHFTRVFAQRVSSSPAAWRRAQER